jgi:hypothetical protein
MEKSTKIAGNPRGARIVAKNRPYSINTIIRYEGLYRIYILILQQKIGSFPFSFRGKLKASGPVTI